MMDLGQMLRRKLNPVLAAGLSILVLIGTLSTMLLGRAAILRDGSEIILRSAPVDPRDLMRGDYVQLRYESVSQVDGALFSGIWPEQDRFMPLWLTLETGEDGLATVKSISLDKPDDGTADTVYLKSKPVKLSGDDANRFRHMIISLTFGIERYYVPEGEGRDIEDARNAGRTTVAVRVSADGQPQIARLMIDGVTLYEEPLY